MKKNLLYNLEYSFVKAFFIFAKIVPIGLLSRYYALLFMAVGRMLKAHKVAKRNLKMIYPDKSDKEISKIADDVWKNLGHNFAEFPFFATITKEKLLNHVKITGVENIIEHIDNNQPVLIYSAHYSNWEVISGFLKNYKIKTNMIYRKMNNTKLDNFIVNMRLSEYFQMMTKGRKNAARAVQDLNKGVSLASFIDQKLNEGIKVPFLGKEAMTPPLLAQLAYKYNYPIIGIYVKRIANLEYELIIEPALEYKKIADKEQQIYEIMLQMNKTIGEWIHADPAAWFWVHNRWNS